MSVSDNHTRYGAFSRFLHWSIALLIVWMFISAGAHFFFDDTPIEEIFWPSHKPVGFVIFSLMLVRILWALTQFSQRPQSINVFAKLGHVLIYVLLLATPTLALLRQYGSGRTFEPFSIPLMPGFEGDKIEWMVEPANLLHSWLGWALLACIIGHIFMAFWHRQRSADEDVLPRMWGKSQS